MKYSTVLVCGGFGLATAAGFLALRTLVETGGVEAFPIWSGWVLASLVGMLALFGVRRRLTVLPLADAVLWTRLHLALGWGAFGGFLVHTGFEWPSGGFDILLYGGFIVTLLSGMWGQWLTAKVPRELALCSEEYLYDRIPIFRRKLKDLAEDTVTLATERDVHSPLARFYADHLLPWLGQQRVPLMAGRPRAAQFYELLDGLRRELPETDQTLVDELSKVIQKRDDLDTSFRLQRSLRLWIMVHGPVSTATIVLLVSHLIFIYAYRGG
ncbi:MAG: hypothetical protein ACPGOV_15860 [Magnetovibrionaceae bacterium]